MPTSASGTEDADGAQPIAGAPRAVLLLGELLGLRLRFVRAEHRAVREGSRTVHLRRLVRDPGTREVVAVAGIGHRTLFWTRERKA